MSVLRFGAFELNVEARELRKHGVRVRIAEQSFCALSLLLENAGRVVTREDLRQRLWPEDTYVEFEDNLNTIIRGVREALGDSARNPRFIETAPRHGYRFVAPVSAVVREAVPGTPAPEAGPGLASRMSRRSVIAIAALLLALAAAGATFFVTRRGPDRPASTPVALTNYLGVAGHPTYSPDGSKIAFHWNGNGTGPFHLYVLAVGSDKPVRLTDNPADDRYPAWSPDGRDIAFVRSVANNQVAIMLVPALGGPEREVTRIQATQVPLSWSPDGRWIAYAVSFPDYVQASAKRSGIFAVSLETRNSVQLTGPGSRYLGDAYPAFSPDGHRLAFFRVSSFGASDLYVMDIDRSLRPVSAPERLTFDSRSALTPAWTPDGKEIVFASSRSGYSSLWRIRASGGSPIAVGGENAFEPAIAPSGRHVVYARQEIIDNLSAIELCGPGCVAGAAHKLKHSTKAVRSPAFSPDGRRIVFESHRSGFAEIWVCDADGANPRQLTFFRGPSTGTPRWAPDGRHIVFDSRVRDKGQLFVVDVDSGKPRQITDGPFEHVVPNWSHDGEWIYFASNQTGEFQIWKMHSAGGLAVQITKQGGFYPVESEDGTVVYYSKGIARTSIWKVPVNGGPEKVAVDSLSHAQNFTLSRDGIYFVPAAATDGSSIQFFDFTTGKIQITTASEGLTLEGLSVSPNGRTIVFSKRESAESDLMLAELVR